MCDSEKKRLESLKQKKEIFRAKELAVQNALKNLVEITYTYFDLYHLSFISLP